MHATPAAEYYVKSNETEKLKKNITTRIKMALSLLHTETVMIIKL